MDSSFFCTVTDVEDSSDSHFKVTMTATRQLRNARFYKEVLYFYLNDIVKK